MKKTFIRLFGIILLGCLVVVALRLFTPEDTWICDNGQRTMHGNPSSPMPVEACEKKINTEELGINTKNTGTNTEEPGTNVGMANPASVYCENNGGTLLIEDSTGGQIGMCTFPDGRTCEERAYMRHECTFDKPASMCTMEYAPVCASVAIQCIKAPCNPVEQTFGNRCQMNANKLATFLHDGECTAK